MSPKEIAQAKISDEIARINQDIPSLQKMISESTDKTEINRLLAIIERKKNELIRLDEIRSDQCR